MATEGAACSGCAAGTAGRSAGSSVEKGVALATGFWQHVIFLDFDRQGKRPLHPLRNDRKQRHHREGSFFMRSTGCWSSHSLSRQESQILHTELGFPPRDAGRGRVLQAVVILTQTGLEWHDSASSHQVSRAQLQAFNTIHNPIHLSWRQSYSTDRRASASSRARGAILGDLMLKSGSVTYTSGT